MSFSRRTCKSLAAVAVLVVALTGSACAKRGQQGSSPGPDPSVTVSESQTPLPSPSPLPSASARSAAEKVPVWPLEPRSLGEGASAQIPVLRAIRTGRHDTYDRVVFELSRSVWAATVRYVPLVHADPSDLVVALRGNAFLEVTIDGAYARWGQRPPGTEVYKGPDSITPGYPTLKQVTLSGDFEGVVSFGIGLDRTAGFQVTELTNRLVIDVAHKPAWQMWPDSSLAQARQVQALFDSGQLSWRSSVVAHYATQVYGWNEPVISPIPGTDEYWVSAQQSNERIRIRQVWPFAGTHRKSIAEIADVR